MPTYADNQYNVGLRAPQSDIRGPGSYIWLSAISLTTDIGLSLPLYAVHCTRCASMQVYM
jgi:hypothetical protein